MTFGTRMAKIGKFSARYPHGGMWLSVELPFWAGWAFYLGVAIVDTEGMRVTQ